MAGKSGLTGVSTALPDVSTLDRVVPVEEQTTLRIEKLLHEDLKMIAVLEGTTIMNITSKLVRDYIRRYEAATGRPLPRRKGAGRNTA